MKNLLILTCLLFTTLSLGAQTSAPAPQPTAAEVLIKIYNDALGEEERLSILRKMIVEKDDTLKAFYVKALIDLDSRQIENGPYTEQNAKKGQALLLAQTVAALGLKDSAPTLKNLFNQLKDPQVRGACALSLARIADNEIGPVLRETLSKINQSPTQSREEEILAFHLITALGILKDSGSFEAVFGASYGWYSSRSQVKSNAQKTLSLISTDLGDSYKELLSSNVDLNMKFQAMTILENGAFTAEVKLKGTLEALKACLSTEPQDPLQKRFLQNFRKKALTFLSGITVKDPATTPAMIATLLQKPDREELRFCYRILGNDGSDAAVNFLSAQLSEYNSKQKSAANTNDDFVLIREIISALGKARNPLGRKALTEVEFSEYTPALIREAAIAAQQIPK